jgi:16S rRNA processing protein RimM
VPDLFALPDSDDLILMGRISRGQGLRGDVKIVPITDDPNRLCALDHVFIGIDATQITRYSLISGRIQHSAHGPLVVLNLENVEDRTTADALKKQLVFAHEEELFVEEDDIFLHDMIGLTVETETGEHIGRLKAIESLPAHDVYVVERIDKPDAWIPDVPAFVLDIDLDAGRIQIRPIDGLLD